MKRMLTSVLIAAVLLLGSSIAGMAMFGMSMHDDACLGPACHAMPGAGASGMECLNHCIGTAASLSVATPFSAFAAFGLVVLAVFLCVSFAPVVRFSRMLRRWDESIGRYLLHQQLSTIVLRN